MSIGRRRGNPFYRCSRTDVLGAFRIVGQEIRLKCRRYRQNGLSHQEAYELAGRVREQRELIRQLLDRRNLKHARRLTRLNARLRRRVLDLVRQAGLDAEVLNFK